MLFNVCSDKSYITTIQLDTANTKAAIQVLTILGQKTVHVIGVVHSCYSAHSSNIFAIVPY